MDHGSCEALLTAASACRCGQENDGDSGWRRRQAPTRRFTHSSSSSSSSSSGREPARRRRRRRPAARRRVTRSTRCAPATAAHTSTFKTASCATLTLDLIRHLQRWSSAWPWLSMLTSRPGYCSSRAAGQVVKQAGVIRTLNLTPKLCCNCRHEPLDRGSEPSA